MQIKKKRCSAECRVFVGVTNPDHNTPVVHSPPLPTGRPLPPTPGLTSSY